jgi:hypothetical protein
MNGVAGKRPHDGFAAGSVRGMRRRDRDSGVCREQNVVRNLLLKTLKPVLSSLYNIPQTGKVCYMPAISEEC